MAGSFVYAGDLARDLGFDGMTPAFWRLCRAHGLEGTRHGELAFDPDQVRDVFTDLRAAARAPNASHVVKS